MAGFCAECGVPLESSTGSCPSCGIVAPPNKKNGWKIVVIVLAVVIGLGVLAVAASGMWAGGPMHGLTAGKAANVSEAELGVQRLSWCGSCGKRQYEDEGAWHRDRERELYDQRSGKLGTELL